jgi:hypothetical protein
MRKNHWLLQERGGPRSVSGEPIEETTIFESNGAEMLPAVDWSGAEISNACKVTN